MAQANPGRVTADMIDAGSFPNLSERFRVMSVPMTVINGEADVIGAVPERDLAAKIRKAAGSNA